MNILYVANTCSDNEYKILYENIDVKINQQSQKFNRLLAEGLSSNNVDVNLISSRPINVSLHPKKWYKSKKEVCNGVSYEYLGFFNIKYVRQFFVYINLIKAYKKWLRNNPEGIILCDILNYSMLKAISKVKRNSRQKLIGVVTDLPLILANNNLTKRVIDHNKLIADCDGMVLLAQAMNDKINPYHKPSIIVEGFCDINMQKADNTLANKYEKKVVMYAGLLHKKYGIKNLTEAFMQANIQDSELHIYGTGDYQEELIDICKSHDNIKYFGTKDNAYVVSEQQKATLLVNPRPTDEEFVKYSFPSKNMEYIASGTPMMTTDLPSMPQEYQEHCFVSDGFDVDSLAQQLRNILSMTKEELHDFGLKAKEWALHNKNNINQGKKILNFINKI